MNHAVSRKCCLPILLVLSAIAVLALFPGCETPQSGYASRRIPVILSTDIGGDIDDVWALSFLLACPELDVKLVLSDSHDTLEKARIISECLKVGRRTDIPIGVGVNGGAGIDPKQTWINSYPGRVHLDGVKALIETIMNARERITLIAIGPVPNLELALEREPRVAEKAKVITMAGCIGKQEQGEPGFPEYNVRKNPKAAQKAFGAAWDLTVTPIDTVGKIRLEGEYYAWVRDSKNPVARLVMEQYKTWNDKQTRHRQDIHQTSSILWDTLAICLAFDEKYCHLRDIRLKVTDDGITKPSADGKLTHVAMEWKDLDGFHKLLAHRIAGYKR